jgi:hypothetical protein
MSARPLGLAGRALLSGSGRDTSVTKPLLFRDGAWHRA